MKFIHTSDWHLGNSMHDIDRMNEFKMFLSFLLSQIEAENAKALILSGDVFDSPTPSVDTRSLFYKFLGNLLKTPCKNIIIIGGNHDSASLLDAPKELFSALNIQVVGSINNRKIPDLVKVLKDENNNTLGICIAIPFVRDLDLLNFEELKTENTKDGNLLLKALYEKALAYALEIKKEKEIPLIATGHLYAANLEGKKQEETGVREIIGTLGNVPANIFPNEIDYIALGHIHYKTSVDKNPKIMYSGSPFVMGFDECTLPHGFLAIDLTKNELKTKFIKFESDYRYIQISGSLEEIKNKLKELAENPETAKNKTFADILLTSGEIVNLNQELEEFEKEKPFKVIRHRLSKSFLKDSALDDDCIESLEQWTPADYFERLIQEKHPDASEDEIKKEIELLTPLFNEALEQAKINFNAED